MFPNSLNVKIAINVIQNIVVTKVGEALFNSSNENFLQNHGFLNKTGFTILN